MKDKSRQITEKVNSLVSNLPRPLKIKVMSKYFDAYDEHKKEFGSLRYITDSDEYWKELNKRYGYMYKKAFEEYQESLGIIKDAVEGRR